MQTFTTRIATSKDLESIQVINSFFSDNEYSHEESFFTKGLHAGRVLVAENDTQVLGYLIYQVLWGNTPYIALLRVHPDYQRIGIGRTLIEKLFSILKEKGYPGVISSREKTNESSHIFHEKMGFKISGTLNMLFGEEVFYKKKL